MDKKYWDSKARDYDDEIFSSIHEDKNKVIIKTIQKYASKKATAADLGCGTGLYLPFLSSKIKSVLAFDLSDRLLDKARERCGKIKNITYQAVDLAKTRVNLDGVNFAISANVLIIPNRDVRSAIIRNIYTALPKGSVMIFVVPSLESVLYANSRQLEWNLKDGMNLKKALMQGLKSSHEKSGSIGDGLINIEGVTHKHYLKEELLVLMRCSGFKPVDIVKVEYSWATEFEKPPRWMKAPYPWDWMVVLKK